MAKKQALVLCTRRDVPSDLRVLKPGGVEKPCAGCGTILIVSPSTMALENDVDLILMCNPCGHADAATRGAKALGIAPGALADDTPADRRRRKELEAHGFRDIDPKNL